MSAAMQEPAMPEPAPAPMTVDCPTCEVDFDPVADPTEAQYLAGVHNDLHHGGRREASAVAVDSDQAAPVAVAGLGWLVSGPVYEDACAQAVPYAGDQTATDRAWSARVDAAVAGMDVLDPAGLDEWMDTHAGAELPHLVEAGLVAAWETHVRDVYDTADVSALTDPADATGRSAEVVELVSDWDDADAL